MERKDLSKLEEKYQLVKEKLEKYGQQQLLVRYDSMSVQQKEWLLDQILKIDFDQILDLYESTKQKVEVGNAKIEPISYVDKEKMDPEEKKKYLEIGTQKIKEGKLACVTMAGGQGTRLGHNGPKGTFPLGLASGKSIFEILCDTLKLAKQIYGVTIPWYLMTSRENNKDTIAFFEENNYFGYPKEAISFFVQGQLPMVSQQGKILVGENGLVKEAADGHGGIFESMEKSGVVQDMQNKKIEWVFIGGVDNVLVKMVDPILIGLSEEQKVLAAGKSVVKANPKEKVGVFCKKDGRPNVIEYTEISDEMAEMRDEKGELLYGESHILCNMFHIKALEKLGKNKLPYHQAFKKVSYLDEKGNLILPEGPNAYKFEAFLFDAFASLDNMAIMRVKREEEFAPVKNAEGVDSPETARQLYKNFFKITE